MSTGEAQSQEQPQAEADAKTESLLETVIRVTKPSELPRAKDLIGELLRDVMDGVVTYDRTSIRSIKARVTAIEEVVSKQLAEVMHHEKFQKLEGSWRGLNYLVMNTPTGEFLKINVLNCDKDTLRKDLENAVEFDQSEIFKKVYRDRFGQPGGIPLSAMVGDYEFTKSNDDVAMLRNVSTVAAAAFCPFLSAASVDLFGFDSWTDLPKPRDIGKIFESDLYIKWNAYRETGDSRFVTLTLPRYMARLPWGDKTKPIEQFHFEEVELGADGEPIPVPHDQYCWSNAAYVLGARLTDSFFNYGWPLAIRGKEGGGLVEDLPAHIVKTADGDLDLKCPTEIPIDDRREYEISNQGFMSLGHYVNKDFAVFFGGQSTKKPQPYDTDEATSNEKICARLPYILAASRFSHYLKILARDKIGSGMQVGDVQTWLERWVSKYVNLDPNPDQASKSRVPLQAAKVSVREDPKNPGAYHAIIHLQPFLQLEELTASLRMVARIPEGG